jgi:DNA helicase-2/ATP-dependent DNA helicase PcrA
MVRVLRENEELRRELDQRFGYILVDEYQDTNLAQYALVRALSIDAPNLAATGDPDQSIYGWRGANLSNILEFERDFPTVRIVKLERNYRSTSRILRVAAGLIVHNVRRKPKELVTENGEGAPVRLICYPTHRDEAGDIAARIAGDIRDGRRRPRDFAVFYRINALSRSFESALREVGVRFQVVHGVEFFQRKQIKDVLAYLRLINNPRDDVALLRAIGAPARGIGRTTLNRLADHASRNGLCLLESARDARLVEKLGPKAVGLLGKFVALIDRLSLAADQPIEALFGRVLDGSGYKQQFEESNDPGDMESLANLEELLTVAREFDERFNSHRRLEDFLEEISLVGDTDDWETEPDCVTLMTLHASKGLEFPVVYLVAVEHGLLPHQRSMERPEQMEEERRLMFVGITRAEEELQISYTRHRDFRGRRGQAIASPFLMELPRADMQVVENAVPSGPTFEPFDEDWGGPHDAAADPSRSADPWADWADDAGAATPSHGKTTSRRSVPAPTLLTAAQLHDRSRNIVPGDVDTGPASPESFYHGMVVGHPEHGLGRVVALSGAGPMRRATVQFLCPPLEATFVLAKSPLKPVSPAAEGERS